MKKLSFLTVVMINVATLFATTEYMDDVRKNTALTSLRCDDNQLTALDVSRNTALIGLSLQNNQLTALDVSQNTTLAGWFNCNGNQLTANALNFLFNTLNDNAVTYLNKHWIERIFKKYIYISNNPGSADCDQSIAERKGWTVENKKDKAVDEKYVWKLDSPQSGDVYVAGTSGGVATIWKNGVQQYLIGTENRTAKAYSIYVSGSDVYAAGEIEGVATIWKNGEPKYLTGNIFGSSANSVYVSGSDIYVAGEERSGDFMNSWGQRHSVAKLWKNGIVQNLSDVTKSSTASSVYVSGNDVYVAGTDEWNVTLWKNGEAQFLTRGGANSKYSVYVSGEDVYVAGIKDNINAGYGLTVWKNGEAQNLTLSGGSYNNGYHSVFVSNGDVYVAAFKYDEERDLHIATLWKNGVAQNLTDVTDGDSSSESVFVSGCNVYVAGYSVESEKAMLWKNGEVQILGNGFAYSVFVVE